VPGSKYSKDQRAEAVALAANIGPLKAAKQLGYPPRTVASWMHKPAATAVIAKVEADIATRLAEAHELSLGILRARLTDPKARLGEIAQAVRVLGEQRLLAEGRATANIGVHASLTDLLTESQKQDAIDWLRNIGREPTIRDLQVPGEPNVIGQVIELMTPEEQSEVAHNIDRMADNAALLATLADPTNVDREQIMAAIQAIEAKIGHD